MIAQMILKEKDSATYKEDVVKEKPYRSVAKSISWRIIGTLDTILISWLITGQLALAFSIGSVELVTKMVLYFFHERIWNNIKWGR
jgi:uncharacterized membrane protein